MAFFEFNSFFYRVMVLLHLLTVIVGFGSSFVWPAMAARARALAPAEGYAVSHTAFGLSKGLTTYPIYAAGATGFLLVVMNQITDFAPHTFKEAWVSIAIVLFVAAVCVAAFLHVPNLAKMDALQARLVAGDVTPNPNGPPPEVLELQDRGKQAAMYGGILHLLFALLLIDMVWGSNPW